MIAWIVAITVLWVVLTREPAWLNIALGAMIGFGFAQAVRAKWSGVVRFGRLWAAFDLLVFFLVQLVLANLTMAYYTLMPLTRMSPGVIRVPLEPMSESALSVLANLITLTPGTLSVDVSTDRRELLVHVMDARDADAVAAEIKQGFEARVLEVME